MVYLTDWLSAEVCTRARDLAAKGKQDILIILQPKEFADFLFELSATFVSMTHCTESQCESAEQGNVI